MFRIVQMILCGDHNPHQLCKVQCKSNDLGCYWWIMCQLFVQLERLWIEHILKVLKPALNNTRKTGKMKKVNKHCLLDTPRTVRVSEKTWQFIVRTRRP